MHSAFPSPRSPNQVGPAPQEGLASSLCLHPCEMLSGVKALPVLAGGKSTLSAKGGDFPPSQIKANFRRVASVSALLSAHHFRCARARLISPSGLCQVVAKRMELEMRFLPEAPEDLFFFRLFLWYYLFILDRSYSI